jgi:hypothetical protein
MDYNLILVGIEFNEEKYSNLFPFKTMEEYITTGILREVEIPPRLLMPNRIVFIILFGLRGIVKKQARFV